MGDNYQRRMVTLREADARRESLCKALNEDSRVQQVNKWQSKAAAQRHKFRTEQILEEQRREEAHRQSVIAQQRQARESVQESKLAEAIRTKKEQDRADASRIELIVSNDPRLRDLQRKLKTLYVTKERSDQLQTKAQYEYDAKREEAEIERAMLSTMQADAEREKEEERRRREVTLRSKAELLRQMEEREKINKRQAEEEYAKDREDVSRILDRVMAEEQAAMDRKLNKQRETRALLQKYQHQHEEEKRRRLAEEKAQERSILEYQEKVYKRKEASAHAKEEEAKRQAKIYDEMLRKQAQLREAEEELLDIRETLSMEEAEHREVEKERAREQRLREMRQEMIDANEAQKSYKTEIQIRQAIEEQDLRAKMLAKFEEDVERERKIAARRRADMQAHKEAIERQRQERFDLFLQSQENEKEEQVRQQKEEEFKERVVQEAYRRLLEEHKGIIDSYGGGVNLGL